MPLAAMGSGGFYQQLQPNRKVLAAGTAPAAATTVYTVPLRTQTEITSIHALNYDGATQTVNFSVRFNGGTEYTFRSESMTTGNSSNSNTFLNASRIMLGAQWELRLVASKAASIDYLITGIEWTLPGGGATA